MFCKNCGSKNPDDAKFCMSCGTQMPILREQIIPKIENKITNSEIIKSKANAFQKILLLISLVWFIVALFYIPYKDHGEIVYDVLWANRSEKIDLPRVLLQLGLLFLMTYLLHRYLRLYGSLENHRYKKIARRELYLFFLFVFSVFACGIYLFSTNFINKRRDRNLAKQITATEQQIEQNAKKRKIRSAFWDEAITMYDLQEFDNKVNRLWDFMMAHTNDEGWLTKFYNGFNKPDLWTNGSNYNGLQRNLQINSCQDLKLFIVNNALTEEDFKKDEENKKLNETLNKSREEKSQLTFYNNKDFRKITLITLIVVFGLLYLLRPLFWFVKGVFKETK